MSSWIDEEVAGCKFVDERLGKRFRTLIRRLSEGIGESIPLACQDWANTKAAYRFLSNPRLSEQEILAGHFQSTQKRFSATEGTVLILHDTTEFTFKRERSEAIGVTHRVPDQKDRYGKKRLHAICGILMHSSLAITTEGLPLGLGAIKFWTRKKFKGTRALKRKINPTRVPIEQKESIRWLENLKASTELFNDPQRCVHIGDRESDIYELFCAAQEAKTHFLFRTCVDRLAGDGQHTVEDEMEEVRVKGLHRIEVRDKKGDSSIAVLEIKYRRIQILPPLAKQKKYPALRVTVIHAEERGTPVGREKINWKLITNLSISCRQEAIEKLQWYALRWKIETWHKILKSGCKAEESKLRAAERLVKLMSVFCILSWRIFWLTMMTRTAPEASPSLMFTKVEIQLLDRLLPRKAARAESKSKKLKRGNLSHYATQLARLGGYLARSSDPPPGNKVVWRGLSRLTDIELGFSLAMKNCG